MAGVQMGMTVESGEVRRAMQGLLLAGKNLHGAFEEIGASLVTSTQQRFEDEESPDGRPWAPLQLSTQLKPANKSQRGRTAARRGADHILRDRNYLYQSLAYDASPYELALGSNRTYAAIQQLGGTPDMAPGPAAIPARPYLGLSKDDEAEIDAILHDYFGEAIG